MRDVQQKVLQLGRSTRHPDRFGVTPRRVDRSRTPADLLRYPQRGASAGQRPLRRTLLPPQCHIQASQRLDRQPAAALSGLIQRRGCRAARRCQVLAGPAQLREAVLDEKEQPPYSVCRDCIDTNDGNNRSSYFATAVEYQLFHPLS